MLDAVRQGRRWLRGQRRRPRGACPQRLHRRRPRPRVPGRARHQAPGGCRRHPGHRGDRHRRWRSRSRPARRSTSATPPRRGADDQSAHASGVAGRPGHHAPFTALSPMVLLPVDRDPRARPVLPRRPRSWATPSSREEGAARPRSRPTASAGRRGSRSAERDSPTRHLGAARQHGRQGDVGPRVDDARRWRSSTAPTCPGARASGSCSASSRWSSRRSAGFVLVRLAPDRRADLRRRPRLHHPAGDPALPGHAPGPQVRGRAPRRPACWWPRRLALRLQPACRPSTRWRRTPPSRPPRSSRRALAETRIGTDVSDALDHMAARMDSQNMRWTTMAIRIQREVGGNLAETLRTTAATLREREMLQAPGRRRCRPRASSRRTSSSRCPIGVFSTARWPTTTTSACCGPTLWASSCRVAGLISWPSASSGCAKVVKIEV